MSSPPEQPKPPPLPVTPVPGSRLEQLVASYETLKARRDEAAAAFDDCAAAIKAEVRAAFPAEVAFAIAGSPHWPALRLTWSRPWRLDSKRMRREDPQLYVRYAVRRPEGQWDLREAT